MIWLRALAVWFAIFAIEVAHGVLRMLYLVPVLGERPARQLGIATGSLLILLVAWLGARWIGVRTPREGRLVGTMWVLLMVAAEMLLGRSVFGYSWSRIAEDFDPTQGGLLTLGLLVLYLAPGWSARRRGLLAADGSQGTRRAREQSASTWQRGPRANTEPQQARLRRHLPGQGR